MSYPWDTAGAAGAVEAAAIPLSVAWLGRTSTDDQQDPTLSLPRQLRASRDALPEGFLIVAHFYDIESGRMDLDSRGRGQAHEAFDIPIARDGGIQDLLAEAKRPDRRFAAVICESVERVARRIYFGTKIEYELEQAGVMLLASDEPMPQLDRPPGGRSRKRSTPMLTRRVKQAVAEWYVLQMLELSWDAFCEHTEQGWNVGKPCYGYRAKKIPHPVAAKRAEGKTKTRLVPHPVEGPTVTQIFLLRGTHSALKRSGSA
ncbi:recombinase family protein [Nonomuraea sp. K274]|uniref:Recombinase family protein n=1 Tax=Nonomuraea cypriaca TaxID=1187855 RepID=A0A931F380_9ACTN|nr:recombinase family protein [Nonomuraea cypriaca]MBF8193684.1 recombinase family protein [Nonomuraea cypriaca]